MSGEGFWTSVGVVASVVAGDGIDVDATDPANPIVSAEALTESDIKDVGRWEVLLDESEQPVSTGTGDWLYVWVGGT